MKVTEATMEEFREVRGRLVYVVDYDIPMESKDRRTFYRYLHKILDCYNIVAESSSQSVWVIDKKEIAESIHNLALQYGKSSLYLAKRIE